MRPDRQPQHDRMAALCASQKSMRDEYGNGEIVMLLKRLEKSPPPYPDARWEIDMPALGTTVYGRSPRQVFKQARRAIRAEADGEED